MIPYSDFKVLTNVCTKKLWQQQQQKKWERYPENKLFKIQPKADDPIPSHGHCCREKTVLRWLDIGHTFLKLIFIYWKVRNRLYVYLLISCVQLNTYSQSV